MCVLKRIKRKKMMFHLDNNYIITSHCVPGTEKRNLCEIDSSGRDGVYYRTIKLVFWVFAYCVYVAICKKVP